MSLPVRTDLDLVTQADLYTVASVENSLDRSELSVNPGITCMLTDTAMNHEGKVDSCCSLRQDDAVSLRSKHQDIVIILKEHTDVVNEVVRTA